MLERNRYGFTIIEVMIFLAISGLLVIGLLAGTSASISRQRYNDSVQDIADFLRAEYSSVINPEIYSRDGASDICRNLSYLVRNDDGSFGVDGGAIKADALNGLNNTGTNRGRSDCAVYGKVVMINKGGDEIISLPLVGGLLTGSDIIAYGEATDREVLQSINANIVLMETAFKSSDGVGSSCNGSLNGCQFLLGLGTVKGDQHHNIKWDARVLPLTVGENYTEVNENIILIIYRSPLNGGVNTLVLEDNDSVANIAANLGVSLCNNSGKHYTKVGGCGNGQINNNNIQNLHYITAFPEALADAETRVVDICVRPNDGNAGSYYSRMISVASNGHNGSAVEVVELDDATRNRCL